MTGRASAGSGAGASTARVECRVWAPARPGGRRACRRRPLELERRRRRAAVGSRSAGRRLRSSSSTAARAGPTRARAGSRDGLRGPSRVLDTGASSGATPAGAPCSLDELVLYELHVGTFTRGGDVRRGVRAAAPAARARRHRDRADAGRDLPRRARLGLRRRLHLRAAPRPTAARRASRASSTPRTRAGLAVILDVVYNHVGPGNELLDRLRAVLHRPARDVLGRGARLRAARRARVGDPERRAVGARLPHRRAAARRDARDLRRQRAARPAPSSPTACAPSTRRARDLRDGGRRLAADRGVGPRRAVGRRASTTRCMSCSPASARATTSRTARSPTSRARTRRRRPRAARDLRAEPRPGRQPRARRPAARRTRAALAAAVRALLAAACRCSSWARSTARRAPFQFFTDHVDPAIAEATREGRRREFARFAAFARRGGARPAGARDVPALEARPGERRPELRASTASCSRCAASCRASSRPRSTRHGARAPRAARRPRARRRLRQPHRRARAAAALMDVWPGTPFPLGATWDGEGTNFSLFSENAERVELCLFDDDGDETRVELHRAHRAQLALLPPGRRARASATATASTGRTSPRRGHRFNPAKLLIDPYAKAIDGPVDCGRRERRSRTCPSGARTPTSSSTTRTTPTRSRSASSSTRAFDWEDDRPPATPVERDGHLRGARRRASRSCTRAVREDLRGTYAGLASEPAIAYLRALGVTAVELLPIHHIADEGFLVDRGPLELLGLQLDRLPRAARALRGDRRRAASRCASSRGWSRRSTAPGSR